MPWMCCAMPQSMTPLPRVGLGTGSDDSTFCVHVHCISHKGHWKMIRTCTCSFLGFLRTVHTNVQDYYKLSCYVHACPSRLGLGPTRLPHAVWDSQTSRENAGQSSNMRQELKLPGTHAHTMTELDGKMYHIRDMWVNRKLLRNSINHSPFNM